MKKLKNKKRKKSRKKLSASGLFEVVSKGFEGIVDHRKGKAGITLANVLMSAFAMFSLKDPSLRAFDERREEPANLERVYGIEHIPSDTYMRTVLDKVDPENLRSTYKDVFRELQRGKGLEPYKYMDEYYLLSTDGTGYFSSKHVKCPHCMERVLKNGEIQYYHYCLGATIVHPEMKTVIPLMPEPIIRQDGEDKNDCEQNASKRLYAHVKRDHPKLKFLIAQDALGCNGPNIRAIQSCDWRFIIGAKPGDNKYLFARVAEAKANETSTTAEVVEGKTTHRFHFVNQVPLNESNKDLLVNFLEYREIVDGEEKRHFTWVTDITITRKNAYSLMRAGRARWKIENETFNTLKNQGYHFEHNFGHGALNLSVVFAQLMMLAFLVDQVLWTCCSLFQAAVEKIHCKTRFWERVRSFFQILELDSMEMIYRAVIYGYQIDGFTILDDTG